MWSDKVMSQICSNDLETFTMWTRSLIQRPSEEEQSGHSTTESVEDLIAGQ